MPVCEWRNAQRAFLLEKKIQGTELLNFTPVLDFSHLLQAFALSAVFIQHGLA